MTQQQQKLCMKLVYGILDQFQSVDDITKLISRLFKEDPNMRNVDLQLSILITSFIKPLLQNRCGTEDNSLLDFVLNVLYPKIFDVMADGAPHILNITQ
jgi:hypothetical protein